MAAPAGHHTIVVTPDNYAAALAPLLSNDPLLSSVLLDLKPPYDSLAGPVAEAIRQNTVVASMKMTVDPEGADHIVGPETPVDLAILTNHRITGCIVTGVETPPGWIRACARNRCIRIPPTQVMPPEVAIEPVDLRQQPWAFAEDHHFKSLRVSDRIAHGAMGEVYRVTIEGVALAAKTSFQLSNPDMYGLDNPVALETALRECMKELEALRKLDGHPNVVGFRRVAYAHVMDRLVPKWICMELAVESLAARIRKGEVDFLADVVGIVNGLAFIHSHGMMHRDIKPANVLIFEDGQIKIGDLGLTKVAKVAHLLSQKHTAIGTPAYQAPGDTETYGPDRDIYAFGVTATEMLQRESPHAEHAARMAQVETASRRFPEHAWLIRSCTAAEADDRPSSCGLQAALSEQLRVHMERVNRERAAMAAAKLLAEQQQQEADAARREAQHQAQQAFDNAAAAATLAETSQASLAAAEGRRRTAEDARAKAEEDRDAAREAQRAAEERALEAERTTRTLLEEAARLHNNTRAANRWKDPVLAVACRPQIEQELPPLTRASGEKDSIASAFPIMWAVMVMAYHVARMGAGIIAADAFEKNFKAPFGKRSLVSIAVVGFPIELLLMVLCKFVNYDVLGLQRPLSIWMCLLGALIQPFAFVASLFCLESCESSVILKPGQPFAFVLILGMYMVLSIIGYSFARKVSRGT